VRVSSPTVSWVLKLEVDGVPDDRRRFPEDLAIPQANGLGVAELVDDVGDPA
jgi:hypothetical protein